MLAGLAPFWAPAGAACCGVQCCPSQGSGPPCPVSYGFEDGFIGVKYWQSGPVKERQFADSVRPPPKVKVMAVWEAAALKNLEGRAFPNPLGQADVICLQP